MPISPTPEEQKFVTGLLKGYYETARALAPNRIDSREFGVGTFEKKIAFRHMKFNDERELKRYLVENTPPYISYSAGYYEFPDGRPMESKGWKGSELVFDLDVTDMNLQCQLVHGKGWICSNCLFAVKEETIKLIEDFLIPDFGFSEKEITINFSGNRGYHVHVNNEKVLGLDSSARTEISSYISGTGMDFEEFFPTAGERGSMLVGPKPTDPGWGGKIARNFIKMVNKGPEALEGVGVDKTLASKLHKNRLVMEMGIRHGNWDMIYIKNKASFWKTVTERQAITQSDRIDRNVTKDPTHLIRLPNSIHGDTGLIAKKIGSLNELQRFEPMRDAIAFRRGEIRIKADTKYKLEMNGRIFGPYGGEIEVPMYAAVYLHLKGLAKLVVNTSSR